MVPHLVPYSGMSAELIPLNERRHGGPDEDRFSGAELMKLLDEAEGLTDAVLANFPTALHTASEFVGLAEASDRIAAARRAIKGAHDDGH